MKGVSRQFDLVVLVIALPVFLVAGLPMLGYAVGCGAWLAQRTVQWRAERRAAVVLAAGDRKSALTTTAFATLGRLWMLTLAILLAGKLADREDGLAAAVLAAVLVTAYLGAQAIERIAASPEPSQ
jgi:hypothetical protein